MRNVSLIPYASFDKGTYPSIAVNANGVVIEGHQRQLDSQLYYNVGTISNNAIGFAQSSGKYFDAGAPPRFAINDHNTAVEIHKSNGTSDKIWYNIGPVNVSTQTWSPGDSDHSENGQDPDIAIDNSNRVVAVHEKDGKIKCRLGSVNTSSKTISFDDSFEIAAGTAPTVALNNNGDVVVIYRSSTYNNLQFWRGKISGNNINAVGSGWTASGDKPSVGLTDDGFVLVGFEDDGNLYGYAGNLDGTGIHWTPAYQYAYGHNPWVDCKGSYGVQVFPSDDAFDYSLLASASTIYDRSTWMGANSKIQNLTLKQLVMPGSHDAGMSISQACTFGGTQCNTRTQYIDIAGQLANGSRYFDIRPVWTGNAFYTGHYSDVFALGIQGCNGQDLDSVLAQAKSFATSTSHEVVVLKFSHYIDLAANKSCFSEERMNALVSTIKSSLEGVLFINETTSRLADIPLKDITAKGSRIIAVLQFVQDRDDIKVDGCPDCGCKEGSGPLCTAGSNSPEPSKGIYSYANYCSSCPVSADLTVYDEYSSTNNLDTMMHNQWTKLKTSANHGGDLFLFSWTLTQSGNQATNCGWTWLDSIVAIADPADAALYTQCIDHLANGSITMSALPNIIYHDLANGFATDVAIYLNERLGAK